MSRLLTRATLTAALMICSVGAAALLTPKQYFARTHGSLNLEQAVPARFGDWQADAATNGLVVNPQQTEFIKQIYDQTFNRTFTSSRGERVMLSIAYGEDQRRGSALHYPEVCYPAQGFQILGKRQSALQMPGGVLRVKQLQTALGSRRHEPLTYWVMVGETPMVGGIDKKLAVLRYGLSGQIPDGLIFRVSTIDPETERAYAVQARFIQDLLAALPGDTRHRLSGL